LTKRIMFLGIAALVAMGCGAGGVGQAPAPAESPSPFPGHVDGVTVLPAAVGIGQRVQLAAAVTAVGAIDRTVTWALAAGSQGSLDAATGVYSAPGSAGTFTVLATSVADATKKGSGTVTVTAAPAGLRTVREWEALFLGTWESEHQSTYLGLSTSGNSWSYYNLGYAIDALGAMFEATGDVKYLDRALLYVGNVVASAVPSSTLAASQFKDGYLGWGAWNHPTDPSIAGGEYPLYESYLWRYVTRLLRVMKQSPAVQASPAYQRTWQDLLAFSKANIFDKWLARGRDNLYRSRTHMASHWAFIALDLWHLTQDPVERARYREVVDNVNLHLPNYPSSLRQQLRASAVSPAAYFWSDVWASTATPGQDVSHANGVLAYIVEARDLGVEWGDADVRAMARTLLDVVWIPEGTGYRYAAYVDGSGTGNGWFNDGFVKLGRYDPVIQKRLESHTVGRGMQLYGNGALNAKLLGSP
jgi:hypothetical protein